MKKTLYILAFALILVLGISFTLVNIRQNVSRVSDYLKWINKEENGIVKKRYVNAMEVKVKYLPAELLAYRELQSDPSYTKEQVDSLVRFYSNSLSFSLSLAADEREGKEKQGDIMYRGVQEYKEYAERIYDMNFNIQEYIVLKAGDKEYRPVLAAMENIYGLENRRSIMLVFTPAEKNDRTLHTSATLELAYDDQQFGLGKNYFTFFKEEINRLPEFPFFGEGNK